MSPNDVFPKSFAISYAVTGKSGTFFEEMHGDLFQASYWRGLQQRIRDGHVEDVLLIDESNASPSGL